MLVTWVLWLQGRDNQAVSEPQVFHPNNKTAILETNQNPTCQIQINLLSKKPKRQWLPWHKTIVFLAAWYWVCNGNQSQFPPSRRSFVFSIGDSLIVDSVEVDACFAETVITVAAFARWNVFPLKRVRKQCRRKWNTGWDMLTFPTAAHLSRTNGCKDAECSRWSLDGMGRFVVTWVFKKGWGWAENWVWKCESTCAHLASPDLQFSHSGERWLIILANRMLSNHQRLYSIVSSSRLSSLADYLHNALILL